MYKYSNLLDNDQQKLKEAYQLQQSCQPDYNLGKDDQQLSHFYYPSMNI